MEWIQLNNEQELDNIKEISMSQPVMLFKHSTRCSISSTALSRLERTWKEEEMKHVKPYFLDLLSYRSVSNLITDKFRIPHESPQVLIIRNGECIYSASHLSISYPEIQKQTLPTVHS